MTAAKQILDCSTRTGSTIDFTIIERRANVGGIWQYDDNVELGYLAWESKQAELLPLDGSSGSHSRGARRDRMRYGWKGKWPPGAMFDGLRTNIACDLMTYRDTPFAPNTSLFPSRKEVQSYLEDFAKKHDLHSHVQFNTTVTAMKKETKSQRWIVTTQSTESTASPPKEEEFSHVLVCHGRCNTPNIPNISGLETFNGKTMHSAWYRDPSEMKERDVLVVGNASSGMDIARELAGYLVRALPSGLSPEEWKERCLKDPFRVYSSWHALDKVPPMDYNPLDPDSPEWCRRINVVDEIDRIDGTVIHLKDGTSLDSIKVIIFATGFLFDNPYIDQTTEPLLSRPLLPPSDNSAKTGFPSTTMYNMDDWILFHSGDESVAFLGLPITVVPFPFTEIQATFVVHRWLNLVEKLPELDRALPANDPLRWSSQRSSKVNQEGEKEAMGEGLILHNISHTFGHPSELFYVNSLLDKLSHCYPEAGRAPPWQVDYKSDGLGNGEPKGPEAKYATSQWRIERRSNGKALRRTALGY
ncbi:hypothetical protein CBS101457_004358 [Exobasidium rhododendri]|nr:hypothetical protein CBS101457_004358 [Exobasidium rhododendri]